jgi:hypothetical protein
VALEKYAAWLKGLPGKPVFVGYPVAYDFLFVYWYLMRFVGQSPFSHSALDINFGNPKTFDFFACGIGCANVHGCQNNPPIFDDGIKIGRAADLLDDSLGYGKLIFCSAFGQHGQLSGLGKEVRL